MNRIGCFPTATIAERHQAHFVHIEYILEPIFLIREAVLRTLHITGRVPLGHGRDFLHAHIGFKGRQVIHLDDGLCLLDHFLVDGKCLLYLGCVDVESREEPAVLDLLVELLPVVERYVLISTHLTHIPRAAKPVDALLHLAQSGIEEGVRIVVRILVTALVVVARLVVVAEGCCEQKGYNECFACHYY